MDDDTDYNVAGARMLGREMAKMLSPVNRQLLLDILQHETGQQRIYRLVEDMMNTPGQFEENLELLEALNRGLHDELSNNNG
nr:hypothetical protein [Methylomarinum sp. Ch1-1]MDP4522524.1 hypothetical protein [Methylomarinum sp. Ch1-1]